MKRLLVLVVAALAVCSSASARNPRLEHLALRAADVSLAKDTVLRADDLGSGWTSRASKPNDDAPPDCPGQDYSKFTITGQAQSQFTRSGAQVLSRVEVYKSRADARGDFAVDQRAGTAACEARALRAEFAKETKSTVTLVSAKQTKGPATLGQHSIAFHIVLSLHRDGQTLPVHIELLGFIRDRVTASLVVVAPGAAPKGDALLAKAMDARLQRVA